MPVFNPLDHPICLEYPTRLAVSSWAGHIPFGMFLIDLLRPQTLVELGTMRGVSYCAFCQAVQYLKLDTRCFAIDTWQGDALSGHYDGKDILADLREFHDPLYGGFSRLVHSTFDEALSHFGDGTIDLLHIDGMHTYEAVRHDFESWLPRMSPCGVIILHDTNVREWGFGVWRFWEEIKPRYPHFEFIHEHGLGLIVTGPEQNPRLQKLLNTSDEEAMLIREFFHQLGHRLSVRLELMAEQELRRAHLQNLQAQIESYTSLIAHREQQYDDLSKRAEQQYDNLLQQTQRQQQELSRQQALLHEIHHLKFWKLYEFYGRSRNRLLRPFRKS